MALRFTPSWGRTEERHDAESGTAASSTSTISTSPVSGRARALLVLVAIVGATLGVVGGPAGASSNISFQSASSSYNNVSTRLTVARPSGVAAGDLMLATIFVRQNPAVSVPSGWIRIERNGHARVYYRVAGSSEPSAYTWSMSWAVAAQGTIAVYRGVEPSGPVAVYSGATHLYSTSIGAPSVDVASGGQLLVGFFHTAVKTTIAPPSGFTERNDSATSYAYRGITQEVSDFALSSPGATGIRAARAGLAGVNVGELVVLRPADSTQSPAPTPTPTPTPNPTPTPTPTPSPVPVVTGFRPFSASSYWHTPLTSAPVDPSSGKFISSIQSMSNTTYPVLAGIGGTWAKPIYFAKPTDKRYVIGSCGASYSLPPSLTNPGVRIPSYAQPDPTADGEMAVFDPTDGTVYGLWEAQHNTSNDTWCAGGGDFWDTASNGLAKQLPQSNCAVCMGHRGLASAGLIIRYDEVASGAVNHVVRMAIPHTAAQHVFPLTGDENGTGIVPEGARVRIKPSVDLASLGLSPGALAIARGLQTYGAVIGDQSGATFTLSIENLQVENSTMGLNRSWSTLGVSAGSLSRIPISDFEVISLGYGA